MEHRRYNVVFRGEIIDGHSVEEVKQTLCAKFTIDPKKIDQLFTRSSVIIKKNVKKHAAL